MNLGRSFLVVLWCSVVIDLVMHRGMKLEFLPAYSPDFNPIELAFSLLKARLRRVRFSDEETDGSVVAKLYGETMSISASSCHAFYHHCGYFC